MKKYIFVYENQLDASAQRTIARLTSASSSDYISSGHAKMKDLASVLSNSGHIKNEYSSSALVIEACSPLSMLIMSDHKPAVILNYEPDVWDTIEQMSDVLERHSDFQANIYEASDRFDVYLSSYIDTFGDISEKENIMNRAIKEMEIQKEVMNEKIESMLKRYITAG